MNQNNTAQAAMHEAIRRALELYAETYDTVTRIAQREGREPVVSPVSVAVDIRRNMVNAVVEALSKLRAEGVQAGDERAAFEEKFPMPEQCVWAGKGYSATDYNAWNASKHASRWEGWQARAALASAPVAGEADNTDYIGLALELESAAKRVESQTVQRAIEAGAHGLRLAYSFRNAAPQASEAVRDAAQKSARAIAFDVWLARHCDSDDLTAYERDLARDAWNTALSAPQASSEPVDLTGIDADHLLAISASGSHTAMSNALLNVARALKTQADKDGAVCSCPTGDGSLHHPCAVHPTGEVDGGDCAKGAVVPSEPLRVFSAGMWTYDGTGQAFSHNDLDAAAFVTYRDALSPTQPTEQGERDA